MELKLKTEYIIRLSTSEIATLDRVLSEYVVSENYEPSDKSEFFNNNLQHIHNIITTRKVIT